MVDYLKKSLKKLDLTQDYEEIDSKLASGWYVDDSNLKKSKNYKTKKIVYKISKKKTNKI